MKRCLTITVAVLLMAAVAAPALAWEFSMTGQWEYRMRYFARTGGVDLFGIADLQNSLDGTAIPVGFAGPNIYNRGALPAFFADASNPNMSVGAHYRITRGGFSRYESDAFYSDSRLTFNPEIRVNPAIRVHGVYNVGGYRHKYFQALGGQDINPPLERYYMSQMSMNAYDTAAIGSWEQFRATIQTPLGILSLGVKDFPFGTGATWGSNTRSESFLTVVPYGPLRFLHGFWLSRGLLPTQESWATTPDSGTRNTLFQGLLATYDSGPLGVGGGVIWRQTHLDKAAIGAGPYAMIDVNTLIYAIYLKYNNGRFFTNAEYAWLTVDFYRGVHGQPQVGWLGPRYDEAYHWWWEVGAFAGPAKVSLLYAIASGTVRNLAYNRGTSTAPNWIGQTTKNYRPWVINYQAMEPYEFLMFNTYGGGNNGGWLPPDVTFVADDHGMMSDAFCFAGRVDYAVASNLNVFGSYIWAHRLEKAGTWKGHFLNTGAEASLEQRQAFVLDNFGGASGEAGGPINPFVDDGHIGWEVNLGLAWKLLEGLNLNARYSYWQPGKYFDQAIQGVGVLPTGGRSNAAVVKGKSAIQAISGSMVIDF